MAALDFLPRRELTGPATRAYVVTPHDTNETTFVTRGLRIGNAGDVTVDMADGATGVLFENVAEGETLPIRVKKVKATGTTATNIVALG